MDDDVGRDAGGDTNGGCCCNDGDAALKEWVKLEMCLDLMTFPTDRIIRSSNLDLTDICLSLLYIVYISSLNDTYLMFITSQASRFQATSFART